MKILFTVSGGALFLFVLAAFSTHLTAEEMAGVPVEPLPPPNIEPPLAPVPEPMVVEEAVVAEPASNADSNLESFLEYPAEPIFEESDLPGMDNVIAGGGVRTGWRKNVFPHFRIGGYYDDNIFIQRSGKQSDFIGFAGFGLRLGLGEVQAPLYTLREARNVPRIYEAPPQPFGNFFLVDYSGTYLFFVDHSEQNAYDQDALLSIGWMGSKLSLGLEGKFQSLSSPDIDAGRRVRRYILSGAVRANYELSGKTSLESNVSYTSTQYQGLIDSGEFQTEEWLNIQITPKLKIAPGVGFGILTVQGSDNQPYARVLVRAVYDFSEKLSFNGRLGGEYRDVQRGSSFRNNPVFGLGISYVPFDGTTLSLTSYRLAEASALLAGADYTRTGVDLKIRQRFLQRFYLTLTGGYENLDYHAVTNDSTTNRNDHYFFGRAAIAFDFTRWGNAEIFYNFQRDSSNHPGNSFTDNQVGFELNFAF